ncbi:COQ9 family protein [Dongia sp.]|uniref:COQ9 family protein n=1 Tax=Dongia sp. TaxID=1977262 RepID=UPI0035B3A18A
MTETGTARSGGYDWQADRDRLVDAVMPHVQFDGWSDAAFKAGAADCGIDFARALNAFPGGMAEILACNHRRHDRAMVDQLAREGAGALRMRERIARAVRLRLELAGAQREAIRAGLSFLLLPENGALGPKLLYGTVDAIWFAVGDKSTDFSFYTKRAILAGVYSATLLYWLNDKSEDHAASWAFLERRIEEVMKIPQLKSQLRALFGRLPNPLKLVPKDGNPLGGESLPLGMRPRRRRA